MLPPTPEKQTRKQAPPSCSISSKRSGVNNGVQTWGLASASEHLVSHLHPPHTHPSFVKHKSRGRLSGMCVVSWCCGFVLSWTWPIQCCRCPTYRGGTKKGDSPRQVFHSTPVHTADTPPCCLPSASSVDSLKGCPRPSLPSQVS